MTAALASRPLETRDLPHIGDAAAAVHRRLLRCGHPVLRFGRGRNQPSCLEGHTAAPPSAPGWMVQLQLGAVPVVLQAPSALWQDWSPAVTGSDIPQALVSAGIAHLGTPLWLALAQATQAPVQGVRAAWLRAAPAAPVDALPWRLDAQGWSGTVHAPTAPSWARWAAALREPGPLPWRHDASGRVRNGALDPALPVAVAIELGMTRVPTADLARMRRHAVLLIDTAPPLHGVGAAAALPDGRGPNQYPVRILAGRRRACVAQALWQSPGRVRRQAPLVSHEGDSMAVEVHSTSASAALASTPAQSSTTGPAAADDVGPERLDLGPVEVEVRFELARRHWPLSALAQWRVGEALPFDVPFSGATVSAWVQERCVASGRLVVIGDRLGLRIDALHGGAAPNSNPASGG